MLINKLKKFFFKENFNKKKIKDIVENIIKISKSEIETISPFVFNWPTHGYEVTLVLERA